MFKDILRFSLAMVLIVGLSIISFAAFARADDHREKGEKHRHGHYQHRHHDGMWYSQDEVRVVVPSVHVVVR